MAELYSSESNALHVAIENFTVKDREVKSKAETNRPSWGKFRNQGQE